MIKPKERREYPAKYADQRVVPAEHQVGGSVRHLRIGCATKPLQALAPVHERFGSKLAERHDGKDDESNHGQDREASPRNESCENNRNQRIRADNVAGEEECVDKAEEEHPPATPTDQTARVINTLVFESCDPRCAHLVRHSGQVLIKFVDSTFHVCTLASQHHRHQTETEKHRKERIRAVVDEHSANEHPPLIAQ